jgi:hypothetical protein
MGDEMSDDTPDLDVLQMFDRKFMHAVDLGGKDRTVTITAVIVGELTSKAGKQKKPVVSFHEIELPLALNKTNAAAIVKLYGSRVREWIGKRITLYATTTEMAGQTVDCIRVRPKVPTELKVAQ